jgi:hypothetical protein
MEGVPLEARAAARSAAAALAPKGCLKMNYAPMKLKEG